MKMRKLPNGKIVVVDRNGDNIFYDDLHSAMEALQKKGLTINIEDYLDKIAELEAAWDKSIEESNKLAKAVTKARNENTELRAKIARLESVIVDQAMRLAGVVK